MSVFASLPPGSSFAQGLAFDVSGNLYTAANNSDQISKITPAGAVSLFKSLPGGSSPEGLAMDRVGDLYVANNSTREINRIAPSGTLNHFASAAGRRKLVGSSL